MGSNRLWELENSSYRATRRLVLAGSGIVARLGLIGCLRHGLAALAN
jgi:hypothetical protein